MRITFTIILLLLGLSKVFAVSPANSNQQFSYKDLRKSKVHVILKNGKNLRGYLVNCDQQYMYLVQDKVDIQNITSPTDGRRVALQEVKEIRYARNPLGRILLGLFAMIFALFLATQANYNFIDCQADCGNGGLFLFALLLFLGGGVFAIHSAAAYSTKKIDKIEAVLHFEEIKSKSLWRKHLERKYSNLNTRDQFLLLLDQGYINRQKKVLVTRENFKSERLLVVCHDDKYIFCTRSKMNLKEAISDPFKAHYKLNKKEVTEIIFK